MPRRGEIVACGVGDWGEWTWRGQPPVKPGAKYLDSRVRGNDPGEIDKSSHGVNGGKYVACGAGDEG